MLGKKTIETLKLKTFIFKAKEYVDKIDVRGGKIKALSRHLKIVGVREVILQRSGLWNRQ